MGKHESYDELLEPEVKWQQSAVVDPGTADNAIHSTKPQQGMAPTPLLSSLKLSFKLFY